MKHHIPTPSPATVQPDRTHWTPARQRLFLAALLETGNVSRAARAAGMSRSSAHRLRIRLAGTPFVGMWDHILADHRRRLGDPFVPAPDAAPAAPPARP